MSKAVLIVNEKPSACVTCYFREYDETDKKWHCMLDVPDFKSIPDPYSIFDLPEFCPLIEVPDDGDVLIAHKKKFIFRRLT